MPGTIVKLLACALPLALAPLSSAHADPATPCPDPRVARLEAWALTQPLNAETLASRSATFPLEKWCADHRLSGAAEPKIVARLVAGKEPPATAEQRQRLGVAPGE